MDVAGGACWKDGTFKVSLQAKGINAQDGLPTSGNSVIQNGRIQDHFHAYFSQDAKAALGSGSQYVRDGRTHVVIVTVAVANDGLLSTAGGAMIERCW